MMLVEQSLPFLAVDDQRPTLRILEELPRRLGCPDEVTNGALALAMRSQARSMRPDALPTRIRARGPGRRQ